jgi:hypothetical protein
MFVRRYLELARAEFRRHSTYRLAIAAGIFTNTVFGFIKVGVLFGAISAAGGEIAGYGFRQAATYVWLGQALLAPVAMYAWSDVPTGSAPARSPSTWPATWTCSCPTGPATSVGRRWPCPPVAFPRWSSARC